MSSNFVADNTVIINASEDTPRGLRFYFDQPLSSPEKESVLDVLSYWASSRPIQGCDLFDYTWEDDGQVLTTKFNFIQGSFYGDLLHHGAVGLGDEGFSIGLVKLMNQGYTPKTHRGKGVHRADVSPICIEFIYEDVVEAEEVNYITLFDTIMQPIKIDILHAENEKLRGDMRQLRSALSTAVEALSEIV